MNYIDILILLFLLWGAVRGFLRGLITGVATLAGLLLGIWAAVRYASSTEGLLRDFLGLSSRYAPWVAMAVTFVLVVAGVYVVGRLLTRLAGMLALGLVNKFLGALLGLLKYFVVVCACLLLLNGLDEKLHLLSGETKQKSVLFYPMLHRAQEMYRLIRG